MQDHFDYFLAKGIPRVELEEIMDIAQKDQAAFRRLAQRRLFSEPMAYLRGYIYFHGRRFCVDRRVYVPNPETEGLVGLLLDDMDDKSTVVDVGTGSGCLAITIKLERPHVSVYGVDIDPRSLEVARANAALHSAEITFFESFYVNDLPINEPSHIISDLPYGNENYTLTSININEFRHMPPHALFHPEGLLTAYEELIASVQRRGWKPKMFIETGKVGEDEVKKIIPAGVFYEYRQMKDYSITIVKFL